MAYSMAYQQTIEAEKARQLLLGYSGLTVKTFGHPQLDVGRAFRNTIHEVLVSVEGSDGNVYTGIAKRCALDGKTLNDGSNMVFLSFRFGENQSRVPLEDKVLEFGFKRVEEKSPDPNLAYVPETGRFIPKSLVGKKD